MAKEKTQADVDLERIKAELERSRIICGTVRWGLGWGFATVMVGIVAWAVVRMTDKPAWLSFALAVVGAAGGPSLVVWRLAVVVARRSAVIPAQASPTAEGGTERSGGEA